MNIFVTRDIASSGLDALKKKGHRIKIYHKDKAIPRPDLFRGVQGADALLCLLTDTIDDEVFEAAGAQLKVVANYAVGFDNIDLGAAKRRGVIITNTPSNNVSEAVAEHTFSLMLALAHRIAEGDRYARAEKYRGWSPTLLNGTDVYGKTLGIIGAGRIGSSVARRAVMGFGMKLLYADMRKNTDLEKQFKARRVPQKTLLKTCDFISLHVPLLPETRHLISHAEFALMKPTAFLVNTARGPVVHEKALLTALKRKRIAGAALDVFECEPEIDCDLTDKLALKQFPNVIMTPHIASATVEAREAMSMVAARNIIAVLSGKKPLNPAK